MQPEERKPFDLKYTELPAAFNNRANMIEITCKTSLRTCEVLAEHLSKVHPKTAIEFEKHESLKALVIKTAKSNEEVIDFIEYTKNFCEDVLSDVAILRQGAVTRNIIRDQSDTIMILYDGRDKDFLTIAELRKQLILSKTHSK